MYEKARNARREVEKFKEFLEGPERPDNMSSTKKLILRTTEFNESIEKHVEIVGLFPDLFEL